MADDAKSVTRQREHGAAYARAKGWTLDPRFVFVDDGVSGAEFTRRPGLQNLLRALKPTPPFDVLIVSEPSRLGREMAETMATLKRIVRAGVRVFCYLDDRERTLDTPTDKMMAAFEGYRDESERYAASQRQTDAKRRQAVAGHVTGGRVFGYRNVDVTAGTDASGRPIRSHVDRVIHEDEARVVVEIFELCAAQYGYKRIAHTLNARGVPSPRPQQGRVGGWDPGTVRAVLTRDLYRGTIVYGRRKKRDADGQRIFGRTASKRNESEWIRVPRPDLRIVPSGLAARVDERLSRVSHLGRKGARANTPIGRPGRSLLGGGVLICSCGAPFEAVQAFYRCSRNRRKGVAVCANTRGLPIAQTNEDILSIVLDDVMHPDFLDQIVSWASREDPLAGLRAERARIGREVDNFERAIAHAGNPEVIAGFVERIEGLRRRGAEVDQELAAAPPPVPASDLRTALQRKARDWQKILRTRENVDACRRVVQAVLGTIEVACEQTAPPWLQAYRRQQQARALVPRAVWRAQVQPDGLLDDNHVRMASLTGFEPVLPP